MALYHPAIMTLVDSPRFARVDPDRHVRRLLHAGRLPDGFLQVLHAISDQVWFSIAIQHLGGIAAGLIVFLAMRRLGLRPAIACVPTACVLLAGDHLYLEHVFMADWLLLALAIAGLAAGVRGLVPAIDHRWLAGGRCAAGRRRAHPQRRHRPARGARSHGRRACAAAPLRDRLLAAGAALAGAAAILAVYFGAFALSDGRYAGLTDFAGWNLYSRVAPFADCSRFDPPEGTEVLCEDVPPAERPGPVRLRLGRRLGLAGQLRPARPGDR